MFDASIDGRLAVLCSGLALLGIVAGACDDAVPTDLDVAPEAREQVRNAGDGNSGHLDAGVRSQLVRLRQATAAYHDIEKAEDDGWEVRFPPECLTHAQLGAMGSHLLNPELLENEEAGRVAVTEPEFLVYEPGADGQMRLVAVEYVVPFDVVPADGDPPTLFGHEFHANETFGVWAFHVWAWRHNPAGLFADWNPRVSCEHADEVRTFPEG